MLYIKNISLDSIAINSLGIAVMAPDEIIELTQNFDRKDLVNASDIVDYVSSGILLAYSESEEFLSSIQTARALSGDVMPTELDKLGRWYVRTDSRPTSWDLVFCGAGDDTTNNIIGGGKVFEWDFSNSDDLDPSPPSGYKRKIIPWQFIDGIMIKEGTMYFFDAPKGCYIDIFVVCPPTGYYYKKTLDPYGNIIYTVEQASDYVKILQWVNHYRVTGSAPMGDELNTESADNEVVPNYMIYQAEITTPDTDSTSYGHFSLEIYRPRTIYWPYVEE